MVPYRLRFLRNLRRQAQVGLETGAEFVGAA